MKKIYFLSLTILFCLSSGVGIGQAIWTVKDPAGNDVIIDQDSSFLMVHDEHLLFYTINSNTGDRNILMTNGDTSFWVLNEDIPLTVAFTSFIYRKNDELIFRVGDVWYSSYGGAETTEVFYDNNDANNEYQYLNIFESYTTSNNNNDLLIEAVDKTTGDTLSLLNRYLSDETSPYLKRLQIYKSNLLGVGTNGEFFISSVFDDQSGEWGEVGFHRQTNSGFTMLLPLGVKNNYDVNTIYYFGNEWIIDHQDNNEKLVYSYRSELDSCIAVTETEFPDYTVLEVINPLWPFWGPTYPGNPFTIDDIVWKGRNQNGSKRYFLRSLFGQEFEIVDLRNDDDVDFVFSQFHDDSIYYYNHSDTQKGLVRTNFVNGMSVKESTSVPFDTDYTLQTYNGKMYFGRYNGQTGTIQAISKDFENDDRYGFLESTSGERIDNPINFSFLEDRIFVHSRTDDGVKLVVFDPDAVVSVNPVESYSDKLVVSPNPSSGVFKVQIEDGYSSIYDHDYIVSNELGSIILKGKVPGPQFNVELTGMPVGTYHIAISNKEKILFTSTLVLCNQ